MIPTYKVNASELVEKLGAFFDELPKVTNVTIARALNEYGEGVARRAAQEVANKHGLQWSEVLDMFVVREATPRRLEWDLDTSAIVGDDEVLGQMPKRNSKQYEKQTLVKIVTSGDGKVCPICEEAEQRSPWAIYELDEFLAQHKNFLSEHPDWEQGAGERSNLLHPNCRCMTQPWAAPNPRVSVKFGGHSAPPELLSARKLGEKVAGELKIAIKAIKVKKS